MDAADEVGEEKPIVAQRRQKKEKEWNDRCAGKVGRLADVKMPSALTFRRVQ